MIQRSDAHSATADNSAHPSPQGAFQLLRPELQQAIAASGYTTPTPIQEQCIQHVLEGRDVLGSAQTGTGKTAAFILPLLQRLAADSRRPKRGTPRALILAPTRELAEQVHKVLEQLGAARGVKTALIVGAVRFLPDRPRYKI